MDGSHGARPYPVVAGCRMHQIETPGERRGHTVCHGCCVWVGRPLVRAGCQAGRKMQLASLAGVVAARLACSGSGAWAGEVNETNGDARPASSVVWGSTGWPLPFCSSCLSSWAFVTACLHHL
ncbi:hypothetical protein SORBI_3004G176550 [Sorghum bicolor]|uniref:Uncharacterized protein n=1 Tax=Sorghum bicolor TaxID=4558 RepID=A0A1Z5RMY5_SORBI|nr:hypothetical protein SORBI_3004G176550 [Sorghum bicolor]OQU85113.1 hypothetical protein SORBI_3004G176550 [Sorghum bicolor]OQU85114.1 hypothetical protein SORBI_3004G176550 [Sorghum bicolor]